MQATLSFKIGEVSVNRSRLRWCLCKQAELDNGESIKALRRFNDLLRDLPADSWGVQAFHPCHALSKRMQTRHVCRNLDGPPVQTFSQSDLSQWWPTVVCVQRGS